MGILIAIVAFIVIVGVLVLVHELGHFLAARQAGVGVEEFGFGFPPRMFSKKGKHTLFSVNWIPLGGFVKIKGIAGDDQHAGEHRGAKDSFASQSFTRRFLILVAGILMNILLTWVLLTAIYSLGFSESITGQPINTAAAPGQVVITQAVSGSPAAEAGLQAGDFIVSVADTPVTSILQTQELISGQVESVDIDLQRAGQVLSLHIPVITIEADPALTPVHGIGVGLGIRFPWWVNVWLGLRESVKLVGLIFVGLWTLITSLVSDGQVGEGVVGPVGIAVISGQAVQLGLVYVLYFAALLSANLAIFNLLPLPALDGGRLLFLFIERVQGKPVNAKTESIVHAIGFVGLLAVAALITLRDVIHLIK